MDQAKLYEKQYRPDDESGTIIHNQMEQRDVSLINSIRSIQGAEGSTKNVAELSVGDGFLSIALLRELPNIKLTCVDISKKRITNLKKIINKDIKISSRVNFIESNFDTQFNLILDNSYDVVLALDIMEHVFDVFNFIDNCNRILKNNGVLLLRVPNIAYVRHRVRLLFGKLPITASWFTSPGKLDSWREKYGWDGGHLHYFTIPVLFELLESYGFSIEGVSDPGTRFSRIRDLYPNLLYANPLIIARKK